MESRFESTPGAAPKATSRSTVERRSVGRDSQVARKPWFHPPGAVRTTVKQTGWQGKRRWACLIAMQWVYACGAPQAKTVTTGDGRAALELPHCLDATECFVKADQTCPKGYEVVRWQSSRPHIIICD